MFKYVVSTHPANDGIAIRFKFPNGFGASVIQNSTSSGGKEGLWELAVLDKEGEITYDTPITYDVLGWLDANAVQEALE